MIVIHGNAATGIATVYEQVQAPPVPTGTTWGRARNLNRWYGRGVYELYEQIELESLKAEALRKEQTYRDPERPFYKDIPRRTRNRRR